MSKVKPVKMSDTSEYEKCIRLAAKAAIRLWQIHGMDSMDSSNWNKGGAEFQSRIVAPILRELYIHPPQWAKIRSDSVWSIPSFRVETDIYGAPLTVYFAVSALFPNIDCWVPYNFIRYDCETQQVTSKGPYKPFVLSKT